VPNARSSEWLSRRLRTCRRAKTAGASIRTTRVFVPPVGPHSVDRVGARCERS
jgi:hypothetical protein